MMFSVIIPSYNRMTLLTQAIESVLFQRCTDYEVIVVDDGSTDRTADYLNSIEKKVKVFHQSNRGPGAARNLGAQNAGGTYLAFLDSDDLWFPWTLEVYRTLIRQHNNPSFIAGKPHVFYEESELTKVAADDVQVLQFEDYLRSGDEWRWWGVSSFVIRRDAFAAANGFSEDQINGEDADLALRLGISKGFIQVTKPTTFAYREHATSATKDIGRTLAGAWSQIRSEKAGTYPGGSSRRRERRRILTRGIRPISLDCLRRAIYREGWGLYGATFAWNATLGRWKYLMVFPLLAVISFLRALKAKGGSENYRRDLA
jgi:glycosyltransferase involved in cell wall biosynthesis